MHWVLALNVGSSSLKWSLFDERDVLVDQRTERFGDASANEAFLALAAIASRIGEVNFVAHRLVHGGPLFRGPVVVDRSARRALDDLVPLAELHMRPALAVLDAARARWPRAVHVAAFDTAFHATLGPEASTYAVPRAWRESRGVRRYGFHGLSVGYSASRAPEVARRPLPRVLVLHLGSGASVTAVRDGRSIDTTMGMTPVEGLVMGTRSGDVDPGALLALLAAGVSVAELTEGLERAGGLVALAGRSDMRELARAAAKGDELALFARTQFVRSAAKHASSMLPVLGGLDAVVFTGGIGEHDAELRAAIAESLSFTGLELDPAANGAASDDDRVVSAPGSRVAALVVHAREDVALLRAARQASCTSRAASKELDDAPSPTDLGRNRLQ